MKGQIPLPFLQIEGLSKTVVDRDRSTLTVLDAVDASFEKGEWVAILGESGTGKSTLLHILGGLDTHYDGEVRMDGTTLRGMRSSERRDYLNQRVGFVFQEADLVPHLSALENVTLAAQLGGATIRACEAKAMALLTRFGLGEHAHKKPDALSGGQKQRVAIARALMNDPDIILADEPTGALDAQNGRAVIDIFKEIAAAGTLVVTVTHSERVAQAATRTVTLENGRLYAQRATAPASVAVPSSTARPQRRGALRPTAVLRLAWRHMLAKKGRHSLMVIGIAVAMMSVLLMLAVSAGVGQYLQQTMASQTTSGAIEVRMSEQTGAQQGAQAGPAVPAFLPIDGRWGAPFGQEQIEDISSIAHVSKVEPAYQSISFGANALFYEYRRYDIIQLETATEAVIQPRLVRGQMPGPGEMVITEAQAALMGAEAGRDMLGARITLRYLLDGLQTTSTYRISGVVRTETAQPLPAVYVTMNDLTQLYTMHQRTMAPNVLYVQPDTPDNTGAIRDALTARGYAGAIGEAVGRVLYDVSRLVGFALTGVAGVSLVVAAIMIVTILSISVIERTGEIGLMKALGADSGDIRRLFMNEAFFLGLLGGGVGILATQGVVYAVNQIAVAKLGTPLLSLSPVMTLCALVMSIMLCLLAGWVPAVRACRLDPITALRRQ